MAWSPDGHSPATYGQGPCGALGGAYCARVTRFPVAGPVSQTAWRFDGIDITPTLEWVGDKRLLLDDDRQTAFTVRVPPL